MNEDWIHITDYWIWVRSMEFERKGNRIVVGDTSVYPSAMLKDPDKYFTKEIMQALDECAKKEFAYGT